MTNLETKATSSTFAVERQALILDQLRTDERLETAMLAAKFRTSTETIRRDLITLEQAGILRRVHGGAVLESQHGAVPDVRQRGSLMMSEKSTIARLAAELVPYAAPALIDGGTTTQALADVYPVDRATTVVTPSLTVAMSLLEKPTVNVYTLGGEVNPRTWAEGGSWTVNAIEGIKADVVFLGCSGISANEGATTSDQADSDVKQAMIASARQVVLMADSSKIGSQHLFTFAELGQIDTLITGPQADPHELELFTAAGIEIKTA